MNAYDLISKISSEPKTTEKIKILSENSNTLIKRLFFNTYSPRITYGITSKSVKIPEEFENVLSLTEILDSLEDIRHRKLTGHSAIEYVNDILSKGTKDSVTPVLNMFDGDQHCGVNVSILNKVWPELIKYPEVMLASTNVNTIKYPAYSQLKADGTRVVYDGVFQTRSGSVLETLGYFDWLPDIRLDGEFVCFNGDEFMDRQTSNGIINKAIKGTITKEEASSIVYLVWDIPSDKPYAERFKTLSEFVSQNSTKNVILIENCLVNNYDEAIQHFSEVRSKGLEGTILKNLDSKFENKRSKNIVKMKAEFEADLNVVGFEFGTGKNKDKIGNLLLESEDGLIKCSCGIFKDFDESIRHEWLKDMPKIVTVRYNSRIQSKGVEYESLFLPRIISRRDDKSQADSYDKIVKEESLENLPALTISIDVAR